MVTAPKRANETEPSENTGLLGHVFEVFMPRESANDNETNVVHLDRERVRRSTAGHTEHLKNHTVERHTWDFFFDTHRNHLSREVKAAKGEVDPALKVANDNIELGEKVWKDEKLLKQGNDVLEEKIVETQEEAAKAGGGLTKQEALAKVEAEMDRFMYQDARGKFKIRTRGEIFKNNWAEYQAGDIGFWKFVKRSFTDVFFEYGAMRKVVPLRNAAEFGKKRYEQFRDKYDPYLEDAEEAAKKTKKGLRHKKEIEKEGAEAVLIVKQGFTKFRKAASSAGKQALMDIVHGKHKGMSPKKYLMQQIDMTELKKLQKKFPRTFASMAEDYGLKARKIRGRAAVFELSTRIFDWYLAPSHRRNDSLTEEVGEVVWGLVPFEYLYNGTSDLDHLPIWAKYSILGTNLVLDTATVVGIGASVFGTGGIAAPAVAAIGGGAKTWVARSVIGAATKVTAKESAKKMVKKGLAKAAARAGKFSASGFVKTLPRKVKESLFSTTSAKLVGGYAALSGLSSVLDYVIGGRMVAHFATEVAEEALERTLDRKFTREQKRLIKTFGHVAYTHYRASKQAAA